MDPPPVLEPAHGIAPASPLRIFAAGHVVAAPGAVRQAQLLAVGGAAEVVAVVMECWVALPDDALEAVELLIGATVAATVAGLGVRPRCAAPVSHCPPRGDPGTIAAMGTQYGAIVHGRRVDTDAASTVEARPVAGGSVVALIAVQGDLATPSLESVKGAFARVAGATDGAALTLARSAPPPPYASGVAVVLLVDDVAHVASTGGARCYRERRGVLEELAAGVHAAESGDTFVAASHASLRVGHAFFTTKIEAANDAAFRNDALDGALAAALAAMSAPTSGLVALAAARVH